MKGKKWEDHYARRAREEKWFARSVYKLIEIDIKFRLIHKGNRLLDLGCYPGSWSQYGIQKIGSKGEVVGIDQTRPEHLFSPGFKFIQADVLTLDIELLGRETGSRDVILSDLAPQTTGIQLTDISKSMSLARRAYDISLALLKKKGHFVCKVFEGEDLKPFKSEMSNHFNQIRLFRPQATRKGSREIYIIGLNLKKHNALAL